MTFLGASAEELRTCHVCEGASGVGWFQRLVNIGERRSRLRKAGAAGCERNSMRESSEQRSTGRAWQCGAWTQWMVSEGANEAP